MSAKLPKELQDKIWRLARQENVSFVKMQLMLLREAIGVREEIEMSQLYLVECPKCGKDSLFYSLRREDWICQSCGYDIAEKGDDKGG